MNKLIKGAVAAAAGVALLMGGAGTFAYWNDQVGITGGTITAGTLTVVDGAAGAWTVQKDGAGTAVPVSDITTFVASPGDKFTYTKSVTINASGNNLVATLQLAPGSITAASNTPANNALAAYLTKQASITATGAGITTGSVAGTYTVNPGTTPIVSRTVTLSVIINFPKDAAAGTENATKTGSVSLTGLAVQLNQVNP